jgi:hypothetical protein
MPKQETDLIAITFAILFAILGLLLMGSCFIKDRAPPGRLVGREAIELIPAAPDSDDSP